MTNTNRRQLAQQITARLATLEAQQHETRRTVLLKCALIALAGEVQPRLIAAVQEALNQ